VETLNRWGIDELAIVDIEASRERRVADFTALRNAAAKAFVPISFGGGIQAVEEMREAVHLGADKIIINTAALENPSLIEKAAHVLGKQCILVAIDAKRNPQGDYEVFARGGQHPTGLNVVDWAREAERLGAGEIFLNSIDRDGSKQGFDLDLLRKVQDRIQIPLIGCGGAGHPDHFLQAFQSTHISALAAGNYFHFTEQSPVVTKSYLIGCGIQVRLDTEAVYEGVDFDENGRAMKRSEQYLKELRYRVIQEDKI
jgi:cyclase